MILTLNTAGSVPPCAACSNEGGVGGCVSPSSNASVLRGVDEPIAGATVQFYVRDILGSTRAVADIEGNVIAKYAYEPFGNEEFSTAESWLSDGDAALRDKHVGKEFDDLLGYYYYGARFYDPHAGRWISKDILSGSGFFPTSLNRYNFCANNPINFIDINGYSILYAGLRGTSSFIFTGSYNAGELIQYGPNMQLKDEYVLAESQAIRFGLPWPSGSISVRITTSLEESTTIEDYLYDDPNKISITLGIRGNAWNWTRKSAAGCSMLRCNYFSMQKTLIGTPSSPIPIYIDVEIPNKDIPPEIPIDTYGDNMQISETDPNGSPNTSISIGQNVQRTETIRQDLFLEQYYIQHDVEQENYEETSIKPMDLDFTTERHNVR